MRSGVNWQEVFKHPVHMLQRYFYYYYYYYYYCLPDINTEIKEVIFNFSLRKVRECKLRSSVNWQEVFKPKRHKTRTGYTGCPRRNVSYFRRVFLMLKYNDITQNTYVQS